jgi:hypothetical protein
MKVYHGSFTEIKKIDLSKGELLRDFGRGFYVTKFREQAEYWALRKGKQKQQEACITEFTFLESAFDTNYLKTLQFDDYSVEWLDFVILNRKNDTRDNMHNYDIVEGPIADDAIATRIDFYLSGGIAKAEFIDELRFKHKPSHQIAFCSAKSLLMLHKSLTNEDLKEITIDDAIIQSLVSDYSMSEEKAIDVYFQSNTYRKLIDENSTLCTKDWTEIYQLLKTEINL